MASELHFPDGPPIDTVLLSRYVAGECTDAERAQIDHWLAADPARDGIVRAMRELPHGARGDGDVAAAWARFQSTRLAPIAAEERAPSTRHDRRQPFGRRSVSLGVLVAAAAVTLVVGVTRFGSVHIGHRPPITYAAAAGQLTPVTLPDGSRLVLAPGTRLRVDPDYGAGHRDVYLDGKASFAIAADPARPFAVIANGVRVQVLGTSFVVDRYATENETHVAVKSGRVLVTKSLGAEGSDVLGAGDVADALDTDSLIVRRGVDVDAAMAWTSGTLVFANTPLSKVVADLERWYGVRIVIGGGAAAESVLQRRVTTTFDHQPLSVVTRELSMILGVPVSATTAPGAHAPSV